MSRYIAKRVALNTMKELVFIAHGNNGIIQVINARNQEKIIES